MSLIDTLNKYKSKAYLPIIKFQTDHTGDHPKIRETILSHVLRSIQTIANLPTNYFSAFSYLISELTDNIVEHSNHPFGYLAFQFYRESGFIDICLTDRGIGLLGSYQNYKGERDLVVLETTLLLWMQQLRENPPSLSLKKEVLELLPREEYWLKALGVILFIYQVMAC